MLLVLVAVLVVGVLAGLAKARWLLLLAALVVAAGLGSVLVATAVPGDPAQVHAGVWAVVLPPLVAFVAGWLIARGSWFVRVLVIAGAALLLAAFPYAAVGAATAGLVP